MGVFSKICVIAMVAGYMGAEASAVPMEAPERVLRAATKRSDLQRRSHRIEPKFESEVVYIENETSNHNNNVFASQVKVASKKPILNLEEIEHHLSDVKCSDGKMKLSFRDAWTARDAKAAAHSKKGGLIISSHEGCNPEGERTVYNVHGSSHKGAVVELSIKQVDWEDSFDRIVVDFGHTEEDHFLRKHSHFKRADDEKLDIPEVKIPDDTKDEVKASTFDLNWIVQDKTFALTDFIPVAGKLPNQVPLEMGCNTCSMLGSLVLTSGSIDIDSSEVDFVPDIFQGKDDGKDMSKVIKGGYMELAAKGMEGYFEFFTKPKATGSFMIKLMTLPVLGFSIPGIGKAGAFLETVLSADYDIQGGFEMTYGFQLAVPDNSTIRVDLRDPSKSGITGFKDTELMAIPYNFEQKDVSAFVSLALLPSIPIGFKFKKLVDVSVEVEMELPRLDTLITTIANADTNCKDLDAAKSKRADNASLPEVEIGSLVHIEANVSMSMDAGFNLKFPGLSKVGLTGTSKYAEIFSTMIPLPTLCLAPEAGFVPATEVYDPVGSATSKPTATSNPASSSAKPTSAPASSGSGKPATTPVASSVKPSGTVATTSARPLSTTKAPGSSSSTTCTSTASAAASKVAREVYGVPIPALPSGGLSQIKSLASLIPSSIPASQIKSLTSLIPTSLPSSQIASQIKSLTSRLPTVIPSAIPTSAIQDKVSSVESKASSIVSQLTKSSKASATPAPATSSKPAPTSAPAAPPAKDEKCSCSTSIVTVTVPPGVAPPGTTGTVPPPPPKTNGTGNGTTPPVQAFPGTAASNALPMLGSVVALGVLVGALVL
ncbi:hypothetical protein CC80DRAFT_498862 [Byssothecium circinans]|uniref:GPI anchored protein-like protein n=1 Tax=Byssothecium circinans TaxID=147558 RepID=A0A6A5UIE3_9PLEO|nr:hypothetical protein CC80DRAFT_498862 [Byssothecium circinans]